MNTGLQPCRKPIQLLPATQVLMRCEEWQRTKSLQPWHLWNGDEPAATIGRTTSLVILEGHVRDAC